MMSSPGCCVHRNALCSLPEECDCEVPGLKGRLNAGKKFELSPAPPSEMSGCSLAAAVNGQKGACPGSKENEISSPSSRAYQGDARQSNVDSAGSCSITIGASIEALFCVM